jgi:hypothetical protein
LENQDTIKCSVCITGLFCFKYVYSCAMLVTRFDV